jgi:Rrf2 family protein
MISARARFATRALLDLTMHEGCGPVQVEDIAARQNIPLKYLQQILRSMKEPGFVESRKGPGGGYSLAKPAEEITLAAVLRHVDGPIAPVSCVSVFSYRECGCPDPDTCALRGAYGEVRDAMAEVLESRTFADLAKTHGKRSNSTEPRS